MSEQPKLEDLVRSWVEKAENDILNIENNLASKEIPWDTVGFHAQQCGEKYLKALLVFHQIDFPKIHDLTELCVLLPKDLVPRLRVHIN
jgi:HEPN domain-containing protein